LHKSNIEQQHRPILDQLPADWIYDRDNRQMKECPPGTEPQSRLVPSIKQFREALLFQLYRDPSVHGDMHGDFVARHAAFPNRRRRPAFDFPGC
jgi:hypothetical protein